MLASRLLSLAAGLVVLTACTAGTVIYPTYIQPSYEPDVLNSVAAYGGVKVHVVGNPFGAEQAVVDRGIADAMNGSNFGPRLNFTPADVERSPYRFVVLFNPAENANQAQVCADPDQPRHSASQGVKLLMAFCNGSNRISSTVATGQPASGVEDPAFRSLLRNVTTLLVPPRREDQGDNSFKNS